MIEVITFTQRVFVHPSSWFEKVTYPKIFIVIAPASIINVKNIR